MSKITYKRVPDIHRDWFKYVVSVDGKERFYIQREYYSMVSGTYWKAIPKPGTFRDQWQRVGKGRTLKECKAKLEEYISNNG